MFCPPGRGTTSTWAAATRWPTTCRSGFYLEGWRGAWSLSRSRRAGRHLRPRATARPRRVVPRRARRGRGRVPRRREAARILLDAARACGGAQPNSGAFTTIVKRCGSLAARSPSRLETIDFLKDRREGAEAEVLAGMDFERPPPARESCWRRWPPAAWPTHRRPGSAISWPRAISSSLRPSQPFLHREEAKELAARLPPEPAPWDKVGHLWTAAARPSAPITPITCSPGH